MRRTFPLAPMGANEMTVCDLFLDRVRDDPTRVAVVDGDRRTTYGELALQASHIADDLVDRGIGCEDVVAICSEPSTEMIAAIVGTFLVGAAYLPIEPATPADRVDFVLRESGAVAMLQYSHTGPGNRATGAAPISLPGRNNEPVRRQPLDEITSRATPAGLAYVIYTSGSTGRPKGVAVEHRSVCSLIRHAGSALGFGPSDVVPLCHSFSFDVSVWEIWTALAYGGRLAIVPSDAKDPTSMVHLLRTCGATVLNQTPTAFGSLLPELERSGPTDLTLRLVSFAGEAVNDEALRRLLAIDDGPAVINMYGITEVTVHATLQQVTEKALASRCPVGVALPGYSVRVLGHDLEPAPVGEIGEIFVGGTGLARGYFGQPALTASRFVPDPSAAGERLYRSGDLARLRADGTIEYVGRVDSQVKIRGFRVEPRETEAHLLAYPGVTEALAVALGPVADQRLAGYLIVDGAEPSTTALRSFLEDRLPSYLIPSVFVFLDEFPLTGNGKLDREALPLPNSRPRLPTAPAPPTTPDERRMCEIWATSLQIDEVGIDDHFLDLGGDSILAATVAARAVDRGLRFTTKDIFATPTVRGLCASLRQPTTEAYDSAEALGEVVLTPVQERLTRRAGDKQKPAVLSAMLRFDAPIEMDALRSALAHVIAGHDALRSRLRAGGDTPYAVISALRERDLDLSRRVVQDPAGGRSASEMVEVLTDLLDQAEGLLIAAGIIRGDNGHPDRLVVVVDHLVIDLISWQVLNDDIRQAYEHLRTGEEPPPLARTTSFRQWTHRVLEYGDAPELIEELPFWQAVEERIAGALRLPLSHEGGPSQRITRRVDRRRTIEHLEATRALARPNEVLLAALALSLADTTESASPLVHIDVEAHGREVDLGDVNLSRTVGCFTAVYPVAIPTSTVSETLRQLTAEIGATPNAGIGFGLLRDRGLIEHRATATVCFNFLGQIDTTSWFPLLLDVGDESSARAPQQVLGYPLEVTAGVVDGQLVVNFDYNDVPTDLVERIADGVLDTLNEIGVSGRPATRSRYPATELQQSLIFQSVMNPGVGMYIAQAQIELSGPLNRARWQRATDSVIGRHDALRSTFDWDRATPEVVVAPEVATPIDFVDWSGLDAATIEIERNRAIRNHRFDHYDPMTGPLLRFACARTSPTTHEVLASVHHSLVDGWSISQFLNETVRTYDELTEGCESARRDVPQFSDYVDWLDRFDYDTSRAFWTNELADAAPRHISVDWPSFDPPTATEVGERHVRFDTSLSRQVQEFTVSNRVTEGALLQASWAIVLSRLHSSNDFVLGLAYSTRPQELSDVEGIVGLLVDTVPVRMRLDPAHDLVSWLRSEQVRQAMIRENGVVGLARISSWVGTAPERPLFDTVFTYRNFPSIAGGPGSSLVVRTMTSPFTRRTGFALVAAPEPGTELDLAIFFERDHISDGRADEIIDLYAETVRSIIREPNVTLGDLGIFAN